jgi:hypothetical protein
MLAQTVLPFKVESTSEQLTAQAGLVLLGEYASGLGLKRWIQQLFPAPGSARGYTPDCYVMPLLLMLNGGGRSLEDVRMLERDAGMRYLLKWESLPSSDAYGDWLRRMSEEKVEGVKSAGLASASQLNQRVLAHALRKQDRTEHTLDIDASQIVAEKESARFTYKGEVGYMPLVGHLAETRLVVHDEFRAGNCAPASGNLEFVKACQARMPNCCTSRR